MWTKRKIFQTTISLKNDTIAAISTPLLSGAIGIIRLSGPDTLSISEKILSKNSIPLTKDKISQSPRSAIYCDLGYPIPIDKIIYTYFKSPFSYTGEEMAEFSLHGNPILLREALELLFKEGARPAERGEFTKRAYLNGKVDLTQAEAIAQMIRARSRFELELAQKNNFGEIHRLTSKLRSELINLKSECEAEIDFSTEDLTFESLSERVERIKNVISLCKTTLQRSDRAESLIESTKIVIYGEPNTGKSSLMNLLLGKDRAIVSDTPGTTRDFLSEEIQISGIPIKLVDTAGIRSTDDTVEKLGIEKSKSEYNSANIKIIVIDASNYKDSLNFIKTHFKDFKNSIILANKIDMVSSDWDRKEFNKILDNQERSYFEISCKSKDGIEEFINYLYERINRTENPENLILLEARNKYHFGKILISLETTLHLIDNNSPAEIYVNEIDEALVSIGLINGKIDTEEILGRVFSKFCVGK